MNDESKVYSIDEVKTFSIRGEPENALLKITAGGETFHFDVRVEDMMGIGKRLQLDGRLLSDQCKKIS